MERKLAETKLYIVVPCYNEEEVISDSYKKLSEKLNRLIAEKKAAKESRIIFVNDGSRDETYDILLDICENDGACGMISFSKNYGHQNAILAGMLYSMEDADAVITIDADLQQDIEAIDDFLLKYSEGCEIVYGVRNDRKSDGFLKKVTAKAFYGLMKCLGCDVRENSADYRLLSKKAVEALGGFEESNLFLRGLIPLMGFKSGVVHFDVKPREAGKSKYSVGKMFTLALDGITSLSIRPIRIITAIGGLMCLFSLVMIVLSIIEWFLDLSIKGYSTTVISIWLVGGVVMLSQGILGEYIGKMYFETKKRPRYIVETVIWPGSDKPED